MVIVAVRPVIRLPNSRAGLEYLPRENNVLLAWIGSKFAAENVPVNTVRRIVRDVNSADDATFVWIMIGDAGGVLAIADAAVADFAALRKSGVQLDS